MTTDSLGDPEVSPAPDVVRLHYFPRSPEEEVRGAAAQRRRPSTAQWVVTGIWASLNLIGGLFFLPFAGWIAGTCPSTQPCSGAGAVLVFVPSLGAVVGFVLWCVGVRRRRVSGGLGWAWGGVALGLLGGFILIFAMSG